MRGLLALVTALLLLGGVVPVRPLPCTCTAARNCGCRCFAGADPDGAAPARPASCCAGPRTTACSASHGGRAPADARHAHGTVRIDVAFRAAEPVIARAAAARTWAAVRFARSSWRSEPPERPPESVS